MKKEKQKNIVIIGAGIGGLTAGILLQAKGYNVKIYEKEKIPGGRALGIKGKNLTFEEYKKILKSYSMKIAFAEPNINKIFERQILDGYQLDLGFHLLGLIHKSPIVKLLKKYNQDIVIQSSTFKIISQNGQIQDGLKSYIGTKEKIKLLYKMLGFKLFSKNKYDKRDCSIKETIEKKYHGPIGEGLGAAAMLITTVNDLNIISSNETLSVMKKWMPGRGSMGYPVGGLPAINNSLVNLFKSLGGKLYLNSPVNEIIVDAGKARGIVVNNKQIDSDVIVSNVPVQHLYALIKSGVTTEDYLSDLKRLEGTGSLCVYYGFNKLNSNLIGNAYRFIEKNLDVDGGMAAGILDFQISKPEIGVAPKNKHLVQGYIICSPREAYNKNKLKLLKKILDNKLEAVFPNYKKHLDFAIYLTCWHLDGVAKTINNNKPDVVTPIKNLYLVGDCVKSTGIGLNSAVDSAVRLSSFFK